MGSQAQADAAAPAQKSIRVQRRLSNPQQIVFRGPENPGPPNRLARRGRAGSSGPLLRQIAALVTGCVCKRFRRYLRARTFGLLAGREFFLTRFAFLLRLGNDYPNATTAHPAAIAFNSATAAREAKAAATIRRKEGAIVAAAGGHCDFWRLDRTHAGLRHC